MGVEYLESSMFGSVGGVRNRYLVVGTNCPIRRISFLNIIYVKLFIGYIVIIILLLYTYIVVNVVIFYCIMDNNIKRFKGRTRYDSISTFKKANYDS